MSLNLFANDFLFITKPNGIKIFSKDKTSEFIFKYKDKLELNDKNNFTKDEIEYEIPNSEEIEKFSVSKDYFYVNETSTIYEKPFYDEKSLELKSKSIYKIKFESFSWIGLKYENKIYFISRNENSLVMGESEKKLNESIKLELTNLDRKFLKLDKKTKIYKLQNGKVSISKNFLKKGFYDVRNRIKFNNKTYYSLKSEEESLFVREGRIFSYSEFSEFSLKSSKHNDKKLLKQILYKGMQSGIDFSKLKYKIYPHKNLKVVYVEFENPILNFNRISKYDGSYNQIQALAFIKNGKVVDSHISGDTKFQKLDLPRNENPVFVYKEPFRGGMAYDYTFLFFTKKGIVQHNFHLASSMYDREIKSHEYYTIHKNKLDLYEVKNKKKKLLASYLVKNNSLYKLMKGKFIKIEIEFTPRLEAKYTRPTLESDWYE